MQVRRTSRRAAAALAALALVAAAAPASAQVSTPTADSATFVNYTAPDEIARDAGEPTLGVNWNTGKVLFQAIVETDQVTFDDTVFPATASWKDVSRPPTNITSFDPILETDPTTGRTLVSQLAPPCSIAAFTDSDGEPTATNPNGYFPSAACGVGSNFDHQTVGVGKAASALPTTYGDDEGNRIFWYCSQVVVESTCSVSRDGGVTFPQSRPVYTFKNDFFTDPTLVGCVGLHGHLNTSPVDGTAYLPNMSCNSEEDLQTNRPAVNVSPDEGRNWTIRQVPDGTSPNFDADAAVEVDGGDRAYVAYESEDNRVFVATTQDRGETFTPSIDLGAPYDIKNATMPTVAAGSEGRAAVAFFGTPTEAPLNEEGVPENQLFAFDPDGDDPKAGWHLYVAMTYDGGTTWTTTDLTPEDPAQRGCIWWGGAQGTGEGDEALPVCTSGAKRNLLDFIDISVDKQGRVLVGWADGCVNRCVTEGHTRQSNTRFADRPEEDMDLTRQEFDELYSQEDIGVITRQSCGLGLIAEFDEAADGPVQTCARAKAVAPAPAPDAGTAPAPAPATAPVPATAATGSAVPAAPSRSTGALPATGASTLLAVGGILLLGLAAVGIRRSRREG
jgi:LPXTG-motif cell wall-anchored protein